MQTAAFTDKNGLDRRFLPMRRQTRHLGYEIVASDEIETLLQQFHAVEMSQFPAKVRTSASAMDVLSETDLYGWLSLLLPCNNSLD